MTTLKREYDNPRNCLKRLSENFWEECAGTITQKAGDDTDSRCGAYLQVNPELKPPKHRNIFEKERILLSRYRTGSHSLRIETGRMCTPSMPREERLCCCNTDVQSLHHVLLECPLIADLRAEYPFQSIEEAFKRDDIAQFLMKMERLLGIKTLL